MNAADWLEWSAQAMGNQAAYFGLYLTLTSAYLIAAFVAGKKLSSGQVTLVNTSFLVVTILNLLSQGTALRSALFAYGKASTEIEGLPVIPAFAQGSAPAVTIMICAGITVGCLKFMWDIRHPKTD
jgi:hypothetical protein